MRKKQAKPFTKEEIDQILAAEGTELQDLAIRLGRDYFAVRRKKWMLENPQTVQNIKDRYKQQGTPTGSKLGHCAWSKAEIALLKERTEAGVPDAELSKELGRTIDAIQSMRRRLKNDGRKGNNKGRRKNN